LSFFSRAFRGVDKIKDEIPEYKKEIARLRSLLDKK